MFHSWLQLDRRSKDKLTPSVSRRASDHAQVCAFPRAAAADAERSVPGRTKASVGVSHSGAGQLGTAPFGITAPRLMRQYSVAARPALLPQRRPQSSCCRRPAASGLRGRSAFERVSTRFLNVSSSSRIVRRPSVPSGPPAKTSSSSVFGQCR